MITSVYALLDPRTSEVKYVGRSINPCTRLYQHTNHPRWNESATATPLYSWITDLHAEGLQPEMVELEEYDSYNDYYGDAEKFWILYLISLGAALLNKAVVFDGWNSPPPPTIQRTLRLDRESYLRLKRLEDETGSSAANIISHALRLLDQPTANIALARQQGVDNGA